MLCGILISVVNVGHVALSINQAPFKLVGFVAGDPITGEKSHSRHSHCMFRALMHCVNLLTIQFQARTPAVYTVPQLLPSPNRFTLIRAPHLYQKRMEGNPLLHLMSEICLKGTMEVGGTADEVRDRGRENDSDNGEGGT